MSCLTVMFSRWFYIKQSKEFDLLSRLGLKNTPTASLQRRKTLPSNECPRYDTKQSDGEVLVMLELWGMQSTPLLLSLPGPLWPGVVAPNKGPIYGLNRTKPCFEFTFFAFKLRIYAKLNCLK